MVTWAPKTYEALKMWLAELKSEAVATNLLFSFVEDRFKRTIADKPVADSAVIADTTSTAYVESDGLASVDGVGNLRLENP